MNDAPQPWWHNDQLAEEYASALDKDIERLKSEIEKEKEEKLVAPYKTEIDRLKALALEAANSLESAWITGGANSGTPSLIPRLRRAAK